jgi:hypothetical protein
MPANKRAGAIFVRSLCSGRFFRRHASILNSGHFSALLFHVASSTSSKRSISGEVKQSGGHSTPLSPQIRHDSNSFCGKGIQQRRQHIIRQVIQKLRHRADAFLARRTARHHHASPTLRDGWRVIDVRGKIVSVNFTAECGVQLGFFHGSPLKFRRGNGEGHDTTVSYILWMMP